MTQRAQHAEANARLHPVLVTALVGLAGWVVLAAGALALGWLVTRVVVGHSLGSADLDVARWFAARRTDTWDALSLAGSQIAGTITVPVVIVVASVVLALRRAWPQSALLVVAMAAEGATYLVATYFVSRDRPAVPRLENLIVSDSYPSGHTAAAVALYGSLCIIVWSLSRERAWRAPFLVLAVVAPIAVGASRVYRGMHNVSDVACGVLIGAGCIVVGVIAVRAGVSASNARVDDHPRDATTVELRHEVAS